LWWSLGCLECILLVAVVFVVVVLGEIKGKAVLSSF